MKQSRIWCGLRSAVRLGLCAVLTVWSVTSCTPVQPSPPPPPAGGPSFVINSPLEGSSIAGPTYFSVQPFDASVVTSVQFKAGDKDLGSDSNGADGFKVFMIPKDFPAGSLKLEATLSGKDGKTSTRAIGVTNVPNPPSNATVGTNGAVLGTTEASGAVSTLSILPGAASGANLSFSAKTKEQVKATTGVDYDALGVTFLGAQEITSTKPINVPLGVSSGGFGPMVQPNQAVVNYMIAPDADGDGKGELMVVNGASVAPGGDVISNPVPQIQLGAATLKSAAKIRTLTSVQASNLSGPPGTFIEIEAKGFNQFSALGNVARFKSLVNGSEIELPAFVNLHYEKTNATPTIGFHIPILPVGEATVTLTNLSSGMSAAPINISIQTPAALGKEPAVVIDEHFARAIQVLSKVPELKDAASQLEKVRSSFATLKGTPTPEEAKFLNDMAVFIANSNGAELLNQIEGGNTSGVGALVDCSALDFLFQAALASYGATLFGIVLLITLTTPLTFAAAAVTVFLTGLAGAAIGTGLGLSLASIYKCLAPPPETCLPPLTPSLRGVLPPPTPVPTPEGIRVQDTPPPPMITGMGSVVPPGGDSCGSAFGDSGASPSNLRSLRLRNQSVSSQSLLGDMAGRFVVKVFYGNGNSVPFTGISDSSGYFYIPLVPAGQPFEAIAFDTKTKKTRSFKGTGPQIGQSTYMYFDFLSEGSGGTNLIVYDSNTQGVHDGTDIYLFEGKAGDLINLAVFSESAGTARIRFTLSDPGGRQMISGLHSGGFYFEHGITKLEQDGLYSYTLDGSQASGNYTLGLSKIDPPVAFNVSVPLVGELKALGDRHFYSFSRKVGDVLKLTLSHPSASGLNAQLLLREPLATVPFYQQPTRLRLATSDTRRSVTNSRTVSVAGEYLLEVGHDGSPFKNQLQKYVGAYQVDISITPAP